MKLKEKGEKEGVGGGSDREGGGIEGWKMMVVVAFWRW